MVTLKDEKTGANIGMYAAYLRLENVVLRTLDNSVAATQRDIHGKNIGMYAAYNGLRRAALKALDNDVASCQQEKNHKMTIGMLCANAGFEEGVIKALDNKKARRLKDIDGRNLGIYSACNQLKDATMKALDDEEASLQQTYTTKFTIGHYAVQNFMEECALKALDNPKLARLVDKWDVNFCMRSVNVGIKSVVEKGLKNIEIRNQQNYTHSKIFKFISAKNFDQRLLDMAIEFNKLDNELGGYQEFLERKSKIDINNTEEYKALLNDYSDIDKYKIPGKLANNTIVIDNNSMEAN